MGHVIASIRHHLHCPPLFGLTHGFTLKRASEGAVRRP